MDFIKDDGGRNKYFPLKYKKDYTGDCVIRAIAIATYTDYKRVWDALFELGHKMGHLPNDERVYEKYLSQIGWKKHKPIRKSNGRKYQLKNLPIADGSYIFITSRHVTAITEQEHRDTWNCGNWCANSYYKLKGE